MLSKRTITMLLIAGLIALSLGLLMGEQFPGWLARTFELIGDALMLTTLIGTLLRQAALQQWGWVAGTLLFSFFGILFYLLITPEVYYRPQPLVYSSLYRERTLPEEESETAREILSPMPEVHQQPYHAESYQEAMQPSFYEQETPPAETPQP